MAGGGAQFDRVGGQESEVAAGVRVFVLVVLLKTSRVLMFHELRTHLHTQANVRTCRDDDGKIAPTENQ